MEENNKNAGIGIVMLADYEANADGAETFTAQRQLALEKSLTAICRRYNQRSDKVSYHQHRALPGHGTQCPGNVVIPKAPEIISNVMKDLE